MSIEMFLQQIANGITLGSFFALVAIGYTMVYGIIRLINFAHATLFMMSMYVVCYLVSFFMVPWYVSYPLALIITAGLGMLTERVAYYPLRRREAPPKSMLISSIGVAYFLEYFATVLFSGRQKVFPDIKFLTSPITIGTVRLQRIALFVPVITLVLLAILMYVLNKTKPGLAMRAISRDLYAARLMGIDVNRTVSFTFAIGSALAAAGAIIWGLKYPVIVPTIGAIPGVKCFIAAVIGGIGNVNGAVLGGFLLGIIEVMLITFFPTLTSYRDAFSFVLLIVILLVRPTGLLREKIGEKV